MNKLKKHRGLRRYYKNLRVKNDNWSGLNFDDPEQAWFDLWHTHFDWRGYGNKSFKKRKPHLDKLFRHFDLLADKAKSLQTDYKYGQRCSIFTVIAMPYFYTHRIRTAATSHGQ